MPQESAARPPEVPRREQHVNRSATGRPVGPRITLTERSPSEVPTGASVAVVVPRLRSVLFAALAGRDPARGAVNPLRWGRPLWEDCPNALPLVTVETPRGDSDPVSVTVETGPNYAHPLRAVRVDGDVPPDASVRRLDDRPPDVEATLRQFLDRGRTRLPAVSETYRTLAGDGTVPPTESRTLCYLDDGDAYRVERPAFDPAPQPMQYLLVAATGTDVDPHFSLALPELGAAAVRPFRRALRDRPHVVSDGSIPASTREIATNHEFVLTPGGVYEVSVDERG